MRGGITNDVDGSLPNYGGMVVEYEYGAIGSVNTTWGGVKALFEE